MTKPIGGAISLTVLLALTAVSGQAGSGIAAEQREKTTAQRHHSRPAPRGMVSADQAVALVKKRADVKKFLALFPQGHSKKTDGVAVVEAEDDGANWNVHVFEQMPDHTATMNWFVVNKKSGSLKILFP